MSKNKIISLVLLAVFAMLQISACFVAGMHTEGFFSVFFFVLGGISCLFGMALDFLLLIVAVDVFSTIFASMAESIAKKQAGIPEEEEEEENDDEEEIEIIETPE